MPSQQTAVTTGAAVLVLLWLLVRQLRTRAVKVWTLWLVPLLLAFVSYQSIRLGASAEGWVLAAYVAAALAGLTLGLARGRALPVVADRQAGTLLVPEPSGTLVLWMLALGLRLLAQLAARGVSPTAAQTLTAAFLAFSVGVVAGARAALLWRFASTHN